MTTKRARTVWTEQCEAARSIRSGYGLKAALDYLVAEKLLNFADAAASYADFAQELPAFVAEVRRIFAPREIAQHLAALERSQAKEAAAVADEDADDDFDVELPAVLAARAARYATVKQMLVAEQLGTS